MRDDPKHQKAKLLSPTPIGRRTEPAWARPITDDPPIIEWYRNEFGEKVLVETDGFRIITEVGDLVDFDGELAQPVA